MNTFAQRNARLLLLICIMLLTAVACGAPDSSPEPSGADPEGPPTEIPLGTIQGNVGPQSPGTDVFFYDAIGLSTDCDPSATSFMDSPVDPNGDYPPITVPTNNAYCYSIGTDPQQFPCDCTWGNDPLECECPPGTDG